LAASYQPALWSLIATLWGQAFWPAAALSGGVAVAEILALVTSEEFARSSATPPGRAAAAQKG